jgi:hypothetical protein
MVKRTYRPIVVARAACPDLSVSRPSVDGSHSLPHASFLRRVYTYTFAVAERGLAQTPLCGVCDVPEGHVDVPCVPLAVTRPAMACDRSGALRVIEGGARALHHG